MGEFYYIITGRGQGSTTFLKSFVNNPETKTHTAFLAMNNENYDTDKIEAESFAGKIWGICSLIANNPKLIEDYTDIDYMQRTFLPIKYKHGGNILIDSVYGQKSEIKSALCYVIDYLQSISNNGYNVVWVECLHRINKGSTPIRDIEPINGLKDFLFYRQRNLIKVLGRASNDDFIKTLNKCIRKTNVGDVDLEYFEEFLDGCDSYTDKLEIKSIVYQDIKFIKSQYAFHRNNARYTNPIRYYNMFDSYGRLSLTDDTFLTTEITSKIEEKL